MARRFVVCSGYELPLADASIDIVFGIAIAITSIAARASPRIARVLRPGGRAIFQEPVRNSANRFLRG